MNRFSAYSFIFVVIWLLGAKLPAYALNNPFPQDQLILCNSTLQHSPCTSFSDFHLIQHAQSLFGDSTLNPDPNLNPLAFSVVTGQVSFIIVDVSNGSVSRVQVERFGESFEASYQTQHMLPLPNDIDLASAAVNLETEHQNLSPLLAFQQSEATGEFINQANQTLAAVIGTLSFSNTNVTRLTPCPTAYSWELDAIVDPSLPQCRLFLGQVLTNWGGDAGGSVANFLDALAVWNTTLNFGLASFNVPNIDAVQLTFNFDDGSKLVITVGKIETGNVTVEVDQQQSRTAEGYSFTPFKDSLGQGQRVDMSYHEVLGMFGHYSCGPQLQATGDVFQRFRVEVLEQDPMGRPTRVRFVLLEQIDIVAEEIICERN